MENYTLPITQQSAKVNKSVHIPKQTTQLSFTITYYLLFFASCFSFFISIFVKTIAMRNILWLESTITGIAAFIYSLYYREIDLGTGEQDKILAGWPGVNRLRYIDWSITTPLMLISLSLVLSMYSGIKVPILKTVAIVVLNLLMLLFGYLGETNMMDRLTADILGFIPFMTIFGMLYMTYIKPKNIGINHFLFWFYFIVWFLYGIVYMFGEQMMNTSFNVLDAIAKSFVAIGLSIYFMM
uniref:Bacteriorhodopsin-like protein n=1 Tax=viral metagenome TaxID=1070528 RepID=A0A6C0AS20_9ZZZZ